MASRHATPADFALWATRAQVLSLDAINHIIADCRAAEVAMRDHDPVAEGFYSDQAATFADERRRRIQRKGGR